MITNEVALDIIQSAVVDSKVVSGAKSARGFRSTRHFAGDGSMI